MDIINSTRVLLRDCEAIKIPDGITGILKKGLNVSITQALGGSLTVEFNGNLYKIKVEDRDAVIDSEESDISQSLKKHPTKEIVIEDIWEILRTCYDPEIPINIVELGLIYRCEIHKKDNNINVEIDMTLTAPGCGMGPFIVDEVQTKISALPDVDEVSVELVFDPPWSQEMMSDEARLELGFM